MAGKVIHVSDELYEKIQNYCQKHDVQSGVWAREILERASSDDTIPSSIPIKSVNTSPVVKKKLSQYTSSTEDDDLWSRPAFWERK